MDETLIQTFAVPRPPIGRPGSPVPCRPDARGTRGVGAHLEADPDPGVTSSAVDARRRGGSRRDVPAGSPAHRLAVSRAWRTGRPDGRSASEAAQAPRYPAAGR